MCYFVRHRGKQFQDFEMNCKNLQNFTKFFKIFLGRFLPQKLRIPSWNKIRKIIFEIAIFRTDYAYNYYAESFEHNWLQIFFWKLIRHYFLPKVSPFTARRYRKNLHQYWKNSYQYRKNSCLFVVLTENFPVSGAATAPIAPSPAPWQHPWCMLYIPLIYMACRTSAIEQ